MIRTQANSKQCIAKGLLIASLLVSLFTFSSSGTHTPLHQKQRTRTTLIIAPVKDAKRIAFYKSSQIHRPDNGTPFIPRIPEFEFCYVNVIKAILRQNTKQIFPSIKRNILSTIKYTIRNLEEPRVQSLRG